MTADSILAVYVVLANDKYKLVNTQTFFFNEPVHLLQL